MLLRIFTLFYNRFSELTHLAKLKTIKNSFHFPLLSDPISYHYTVSMNFTYSRYLMYMVSYNIFMTALFYLWDSLVVQTVKRMPAMWETQVQSLGREDPLEKEIATHASTFAWKIPWMEEPGGLQPMGSQKVGHD